MVSVVPEVTKWGAGNLTVGLVVVVIALIRFDAPLTIIGLTLGTLPLGFAIARMGFRRSVKEWLARATPVSEVYPQRDFWHYTVIPATYTAALGALAVGAVTDDRLAAVGVSMGILSLVLAVASLRVALDLRRWEREHVAQLLWAAPATSRTIPPFRFAARGGKSGGRGGGNEFGGLSEDGGQSP